MEQSNHGTGMDIQNTPVPFTLLEGPWDRLAQIKEKLPGPIVKLQMPLSPLEKYPLLEMELF